MQVRESTSCTLTGSESSTSSTGALMRNWPTRSLLTSTTPPPQVMPPSRRRCLCLCCSSSTGLQDWPCHWSHFRYVPYVFNIEWRKMNKHYIFLCSITKLRSTSSSKTRRTWPWSEQIPPTHHPVCCTQPLCSLTRKRENVSLSSLTVRWHTALCPIQHTYAHHCCSCAEYLVTLLQHTGSESLSPSATARTTNVRLSFNHPVKVRSSYILKTSRTGYPDFQCTHTL